VLLLKKIWVDLNFKGGIYKVMNHKTVRTGIGLAVALLFAAGLTFAKSEQISVLYPAKVSQSVMLKVGTYRVSVSINAQEPEAMFYRNNKLVARVPVKLLNETKKNDQTMIYYDTIANNQHAITQIDLAGWREKLLFPAAKLAVKSGQ